MSRLKIVPDAEPNADGEWIESAVEFPPRCRWLHMAALVEQQIPAGYHVVAIECGSRNVTPVSQRVLPLRPAK